MDENIMNEIKNCISSSEIPKNLLRYEITESAYTTIDAAGNQFLSDFRRECGYCLTILEAVCPRLAPSRILSLT